MKTNLFVQKFAERWIELHVSTVLVLLVLWNFCWNESSRFLVLLSYANISRHYKMISFYWFQYRILPYLYADYENTVSIEFVVFESPSHANFHCLKSYCSDHSSRLVIRWDVVVIWIGTRHFLSVFCVAQLAFEIELMEFLILNYFTGFGWKVMERIWDVRFWRAENVVVDGKCPLEAIYVLLVLSN